MLPRNAKWLLVGFGDHGARTVFPRLWLHARHSGHAPQKVYITDKEPATFSALALQDAWDGIDKHFLNRAFPGTVTQYAQLVNACRLKQCPKTHEDVKKSAIYHDENPLVVYIATKPEDYPPILDLYLDHAHTVILEKPLATSRADLTKLEQTIAARPEGRRATILYVDHYTRKWAIRIVRTILGTALGRTILDTAGLVELRMFETQLIATRRKSFYDDSLRLNALYDMGVHLIALLDELFGYPNKMHINGVYDGSYNETGVKSTFCMVDTNVMIGTRREKRVLLSCGKGFLRDEKTLIFTDSKYRLEVDIGNNVLMLSILRHQNGSTGDTISLRSSSDAIVGPDPDRRLIDAYESVFFDMSNDKTSERMQLEDGRRHAETLFAITDHLEDPHTFCKRDVRYNIHEVPHVIDETTSHIGSAVTQRIEPFVILDTFGIFIDHTEYLLEKFRGISLWCNNRGIDFQEHVVTEQIKAGNYDERQILARALGEINRSIKEDVVSYYESIWPDWAPMLVASKVRDDLTEFISWIKFNRARFVLLSFAPTQDLYEVVKRIELRYHMKNVFDGIYGRTKVWEKANEAETVEKALDCISESVVFLPARRGVLVDDSETNREAARKKEMKDVAMQEYTQGGEKGELGKWLISKIAKELDVLEREG